MAGELIIRSRVNSHKRNIQPAKNPSLGLLLTLSDSCEKALFEIHGFVEDELAHFKLKELAEKPGE
jgi:hypothetical protein